MNRYYKFDSVIYHESLIPEENRVYGTPVLVIDPDDREAMQELAEAFCAAPSSGWTGQMQAAIRSLLNPKPAEPKGLGAVVKDRKGFVWVRVVKGLYGWRRSDGLAWRSWDRLDIPDESHILSPGVEVE